MYEHLASVSVGFDQVRNSLMAFRDLRGFDRSEIDHFVEMAIEARAASLSYITGAIEGVETDEAARVQNKRLRRERRDGGNER